VKQESTLCDVWESICRKAAAARKGEANCYSMKSTSMEWESICRQADAVRKGEANSYYLNGMGIHL
jgi:hypothetical protein